MRCDCGKLPILISVHLTGIPPHCPTALTLFKKCGGNETHHRTGPPQRTRNFLEYHLLPRGTVKFVYRHTSWGWLVGSWRKVRLFRIRNFCTADPFPGTHFSQLWREFFLREIRRDRICGSETT